jgi:outer membrane protein TolC
MKLRMSNRGRSRQARLAARARAGFLAAALALLTAAPAAAQGQGEAYAQALARLKELASPGVATTNSTSASAAPGALGGYGLTELMAILERGTPELRASQAAVAAAEGRLATARAYRYPTLSGELSAAYLGNPQEAIVLPAGSLMPPAVPPQDVELFPAVDPTQYGVKLIAELPLFTWGKTSAGIKAAAAGRDVSLIMRAKTEHEAKARLKALYESLSYIAESESVAKAQLTAAERLVALAESNSKSGFATRAELLEARVAEREIRLVMATLAERRGALVAQLADLLGLSDLRFDQLRLAPPGLRALPDDAETAVRSAQAGSYDLALAGAAVDAKAKVAELARTQARGLPDLGLRVELSYAGSKLPWLQDGWRDANDYQLIVGLGAKGKLGDWVKAAELKAAMAELAEAQAGREAAAGAIAAFVRERYLAAQLLQDKIELALLRQEAYEATLENKRVALSVGGGTESEYLAALIRALGGIIEAYGYLAEYSGALVAIETAFGAARP